jgi:hypothetical protein
MAPPPDESPGRALALALAAMAGVALLVGLAVGGVALGLVSFAGGDGSGASAEEAPDSLFIPEYSPTKRAEDELGLPSYEPSPSPKLGGPAADPSPKADRITLFVAPQAVSPGERINFNGVYVDGEGIALQIQRKEGGSWTDFPVTATVRGGVFETWIQTSRTGKAAFRVVDEEADRSSNVVRVTIG